MLRRPPRSTLSSSSAASDVYKRQLLLRFHSMIGKDLGEHFDAVPGRFREDQRVVGKYRCPDFHDVPGLVDKLCTWLQTEFGYDRGDQSFGDAVTQAIASHVYIEWVYPVSYTHL